MFEVRYEGLRETLQALRVIQHGLYLAMLDGLKKSGDIVRSDAAQRFESWGGDRRGIAQAASGFRVFVRPNSSTMAVLSVGQTLSRSANMSLRRSNFGGLMMTKALLPARQAKLPAVVAAIDESVTVLLRANGF